MPSDSLSPEEQYELTYRATKNALWDVLGTAVYLLFLIFAVSLAVFVFVLPAVGSLTQGNAPPLVLGIGALGLVVAGYGAYRISQLIR